MGDGKMGYFVSLQNWYCASAKVTQLVRANIGKCGPNRWHMVLGLNPITDGTLNLLGASCYGAVSTRDRAELKDSYGLYQAKAKTEGTSFTVSHDGDHQSPGSVLEASFSNESFSSSLDDRHKLHPGSIDYSYDQPESSEADTDLLDSATSLSKWRTGSEAVADLVNYISSIVHAINLPGARLGGSKLTHVKEVILNAELLFGNAALANSDGCRSFLGHFLVAELETLTCATWTKSDIFPGFEDNTKGRNQVTGFLFDSVIEYLDTKYCIHADSGYKAWTRLPWLMNGEKLIKLVVEEIRRWADLAGRIPDEIIEWEMSHSLGKWTDFEIEGFETGAEIDSDILQILVDEIVVDLKECSLNSSYI
ncbi:hypothetical protein CK203_048152 [Vitis vinifera]|uniref:DUF4378 domain-containing protein n=1 Tax=Vitis vinifera TaxID=29760 RepID=A0A438HJG1_VITVI|nr:hypothetical protein CK203_048152 [Vitis vinifera]